MNEGKLIQVIGPVVDVEFSDGELHEILTGLLITNPAIDDTEDNLVVEVADSTRANCLSAPSFLASATMWSDALPWT